MKKGKTAKPGAVCRAAGGQVTVFVSLVMMCLFAFFCVLVESARTAGARWYLQMAADSALDSVFSQYHRELWDSYRLLFAEYEDEEQVLSDFAGYLGPYLDAENWYPMEYQTAEVTQLLRATDDQGMYLEQEILDYMKYGVWNLDFDEEAGEMMRIRGREAEAVEKVAETYRGHAKEALKLERALEAVSENLAEQEESRQQGLAHLRGFDGSGFRQDAARLVRKLERIPGLVEYYRKLANRLAHGLEQSRADCIPQREQCSEQVDGLLETEISEYEAYVAQDGERRLEIEQLESWSKQQIVQVEAIIEEAREVERIIEEWEDSEEENDDEDEDDGDDGPDLEALWSPVISHFEQIQIRQLSFQHGVKDKEKEGWLNQVEQMYHSGLTSMLVPDGVNVSERHAELSEMPSQEVLGAVRGGASLGEKLIPGGRTASLTDRLLVNEYCGEFFSCFDGAGEGVADTGDTMSECTDRTEQPLRYEVEYLIGGQASDEENLSSAIHQLLAIREGLNLVHILSDPEKRAEARSLALVITGLAAVTPLVLIATFFILSVWALGEAMLDIRGLLAGRKVPVLKTADDWNLSLDGLLSMGNNRKVGTGGGEQGLGYLSWLKILLFLDEIVRQEYRMMDVMQMNLRLAQDSFRMRRGVYQLGITGKLCGKHVFFSPWFVEKLTGQTDHRYLMAVQTERAY